MKTTDLKNKRVLITGATDGIGLHLAKILRARGAELILVVRDAKRWTDGAATLIEVDLSRAEAVERILAAVDLATIDVLVNNAGASRLVPFAKLATKEVIELFHLNLVTPAALSNAFIRIARPSAMLVNVTSIAGAMPLPNNALYCAAKAAMRALTRSLSVESRARQINVLDFCPGSVKTDFHKKAAGAAHVKGGLAIDAATAGAALVRLIERRRGGVAYPDWVARIVALLAWRVTDRISLALIRRDARRRLGGA